MSQSKGNFEERRKFPRLDRNIPVKICGDEFDAVTETQNVSRAGAFCRVDEYIEPMTKLKVQLLLSMRKGGKRLQTKKVACDGVVVRTEPASNNEKGYYVAIFFSDISDKDANVISDFIQFGVAKDQKEHE